jgi:hypothetical protein
MLDIFLIGVGGQGLLTIGEVIADAAVALDLPVCFYPYKGMAQRGGLVKAQLRLGRSAVGPNIPPRGADLVIAMEVSEALRAVRVLRPGGEFLLFGERWLPTAVLLGKAAYPALETVLEQVRAAGGIRSIYPRIRCPLACRPTCSYWGQRSVGPAWGTSCPLRRWRKPSGVGGPETRNEIWPPSGPVTQSQFDLTQRHRDTKKK